MQKICCQSLQFLGTFAHQCASHIFIVLANHFLVKSTRYEFITCSPVSSSPNLYRLLFGFVLVFLISNISPCRLFLFKENDLLYLKSLWIVSLSCKENWQACSNLSYRELIISLPPTEYLPCQTSCWHLFFTVWAMRFSVLFYGVAWHHSRLLWEPVTDWERSVVLMVWSWWWLFFWVNMFSLGVNLTLLNPLK